MGFRVQGLDAMLVGWRVQFLGMGDFEDKK